MRVNRLLSVTFLNILQKKWNYLKMVIGFLLCFLAIVILCLYSGSLLNTCDSYKNYFMYSNFLSIEGDSFTDEQIKEIKDSSQVRSLFSYCPIQLTFNPIIVDNDEYNYEGNINKYPLIALIDEKSDCTIQKNIEISFYEDYDQEVILYGRDILDTNEALLNEQILEDFGIEERESLIGKTILINNDYIVAERVICGIVNKNILSGTKNNSYNSRFYVTMYNTNLATEIAPNITINYTHCIDLKDYSDSQVLIEKLETMFEAKCIDSRPDYVIENVRILLSQQELCNKFLSVVSALLTAIVILYIVINQFFVLQQNRLFYGLLQSYGLSSKQLFVVSFLEIFLITLIAGLISLLGGVGIFFILKDAVLSILYIELQFNIGYLILAIFSIATLGIILALCLAFFMTFKFFRKSPIFLLKNKEQ